MIARGFKPVAWVAAIGTAALGCYMLSLQVAAERAELAGIERRIVGTQQAIRALHTELGTRGRLQQLETWNAEVLALSAPAANQFLESTISLARFDTDQPPVPVEAPVRMASAEAAPAPAPAAVETRPAVRLASATTPPATAAPGAAPERPAVRRTSLAAAEPVAVQVAAPPQRSASEPRRAASLLDDGTLRDLRSQARSEQGGGTRN